MKILESRFTNENHLWWRCCSWMLNDILSLDSHDQELEVRKDVLLKMADRVAECSFHTSSYIFLQLSWSIAAKCLGSCLWLWDCNLSSCDDRLQDTGFSLQMMRSAQDAGFSLSRYFSFPTFCHQWCLATCSKTPANVNQDSAKPANPPRYLPAVC